MKKYSIAVAGTGYVGMSLAVLLAQNNKVTAVDIIRERTDLINKRRSPIRDEYIEKYLSDKNLDLSATVDAISAYQTADYVIIAVPTDYDSEKSFFDTSSVESAIKLVISVNPNAIIVIKSTVPVGFTEYIRRDLKSSNIIFSPEFLRESRALYDNLYPSRIIVGTDLTDDRLLEASEKFIDLLKDGAIKPSIDTLIMGFTEAEAVKLFSNTYLAMRVSYFNEVDTYAEVRKLDTRKIIEGICLDPRIGSHYNNPSFGYGGYCLPKDTKQLLADYSGIPQNMISAIVDSNNTRKSFIAERVLETARKEFHKNPGDDFKKRNAPTVGVFRLAMKAGSDNFRESSVRSVMEKLREKGVDVIIYEPAIQDSTAAFGSVVVNDLSSFKLRSDCIIANRYDACLDDVKGKVYTRDAFGRD